MRRSILACVALSALVLGGCGLGGISSAISGGAPSRPAPTKTVVVVVDLSASTLPFRSLYLQTVKTVIQSLHAGDVLAVAEITSSSITRPTVPILKVIKPFVPLDAAGNPTNNPLLVRKDKLKEAAKLRKVRAQLDLQAQQLFSPQGQGAESTQYTDIMSALTVAQNLFDANKRDEARLVVLSDMMEDAGQFNFYEPVTASVTQAIIQTETSSGQLPDLKGVQVFAVADGTESTATYFSVRSFWLRYFAATGADLKAQDYSNTLNGYGH